MDDLVEEFITETNEGLDELDLDLVKLEQDPNDKELLGKIFRLIHTIKGTCGFLGLPRLEKVAHHGENVLGRFRDGDLNVTPEYVSLIFESLDHIKYMVGEIEATGAEPDGDDTELIEKLDVVFLSGKEDTSGAEEETAEAPVEEEMPCDDVTDGEVGKATEAEMEAAFAAAEAKSPEELRAELDAEAGSSAPQAQAEDETPEEDAQADIEVLDEPAETEAPLAEPEAASPPPPPPAKEAPEADSAPKKAPSAATLRVNVDVLEDLMTMVSELVLTRNQLLQILRAQTDSDFTTPLHRLNQIVSELQEGVMKTRMQPIGKAWAKLPRIIRDLGIELKKKIALEMLGEDTELDRQVLDLIKDPLTHMVRNSGDHGIEDPEARIAAGKPETGTITLNAFHEGGHIIISISDDGKGLSTESIKKKAIENGLATAEELEEMPTQQIQQFIFKAGFSTAEKVTAVSGRGVGMDVVRTNIEKIGGSIELNSIEGKGSTFTIKIPLTLAIVSALIVEAAGERFAIPQLSVRELVMTSEHADNKIELVNGSPVFRLRDSLLPLVPLGELLKLRDASSGSAFSKPESAEDMMATQEDIVAVKAQIQEILAHQTGADQEQVKTEAPANDEAPAAEAPPEDDADGEAGNVINLEESIAQAAADSSDQADGNTYIVVTQVGSSEFGIIVDRVFDTEEIVVKPVSTILRDIDLFSGNTILGDGSVIMILDPNGIARRSGEMENADTLAAQEQSAQDADARGEKESLLLFDGGDGSPKAVPLSLVSRLENIDVSNIEESGGQMMVQYREQLMPLTLFNDKISIPEEGELPVIVFADRGKSLGVIVNDIVDIIEERIKVQLSGSKPGLVGSAIIGGKATDVVDVMYFLSRHSDDWFKNHGDEDFGSDTDKRKVLLVDDSPFFRNMLTPLLSIAGYEVTPLESAQDALQMCEEGSHFDVIISDIEMPDMNGFEFAEALRANPDWSNTPLVALSSHTTPQDIDRGSRAGFNEYVAKFDRDTLLNTLSQTLSVAQGGGE